MKYELNEKAMVQAVEPILEYLSITLRSKRFQYQIDGYGNDFSIQLISSLDNELEVKSTASLLKFDQGKSAFDSTSYEKKLNNLLIQSEMEYLRINMLLGNINQLKYKQKYILVYAAILKISINEICKKLNISASTYYRLMHIAKFNFALLLPEVYETKIKE